MSAVDVMRGAFDYRGSAGAAVKQLKFSRALDAAAPMAAFVRPLAKELTFDYVVPVPIHWSRHSHRGFNQAEVLARHSGLPFRTDLLRRVRATWPQARSEASVRRSALQGAFRSKSCPGARVLLLDDVVFKSEFSAALYLLPLLSGAVGANLISHVLVQHLEEAEKRHERERHAAHRHS